MIDNWEDYIRDRANKAKEWVSKYPFLRFKDNSCCPWEDTKEIKNCWMFELPDGWYEIGSQMCDELMIVLGKHADDFIIGQLKEKYNVIRCYWHWADIEYTEDELKEMYTLSDAIENILLKYEKISYNTCTICGKPATKWTNGWIASYCDSCYERFK